MFKLKTKLKLEQLVREPNLVEYIEKADLGIIAQDVITSHQQDFDSRAKWEHLTEEVLKLANMEKEIKNTPWPNASNVKYPIICTAVLQFAARTYPEIVRNGKVVDIAVTAQDPTGQIQDKARRVAQKMNDQLLVESDTWETSFDKLLHAIPLVGHAFKKVYYDPVKMANVSELIPYTDIAIHQDIESLEKAPRVTHSMKKTKNELLEMIRLDLFSISDESKLDTLSKKHDGDERIDILEQHRFLDLDGDGYEEPYIVTVLKDSDECLRIVSRFNTPDIRFNKKGDVQAIDPEQYFQDYICMHNPDGSYWGLGLGHLLLDLNASIDTILNQLIDSGTLSNMQSGFADRSVRVKGGDFQVQMGKIAKLDTALTGALRDHIYMMEFKEPSTVLYQLLQVLIQSAKELASINDATMGQEHVQNVASSVIASQIEQGTKIFSGIQRRLFRGLKKEFQALFRLNSLFLDMDQYAKQCALPVEQVMDDWDTEGIDIKPVADPAMGNESSRLQRAQAILELCSNPAFQDKVNKHEAGRIYLEAIKAPNIERILIPPDPEAPPPPEVIEMMSKIDAQKQQLQLSANEQQLKAMELQIRAEVSSAEADKFVSEAELNRAKAEGARLAPTLQKMSVEKDMMKAGLDHRAKLQTAQISAEAKQKKQENKPNGEVS